MHMVYTKYQIESKYVERNVYKRSGGLSDNRVNQHTKKIINFDFLFGHFLLN